MNCSASQPSSLSEVTENQDGFVVQRGRAVPTLTAVVDKSEKEQFNKDTKSEELGESESEHQNVFQQMKNIPVAGRPSEPSNNTGIRRTSKSFSRRNSVDDNASTLSLENLGGSQDNLSLLGRNPDKEMRTHVGRKEAPHEALNNDHRYLDNREIEEMERRQRDSVSPLKSQQYVRLTSASSEAGGDKVSFADLRKQKARDQFHSSGINITYTEHEKEDLPKKSSTSTLLQQRRDSQSQNQLGKQQDELQSTPGPDAMAAQLNSVRMKLEQRRKRIEEEKRKMENVMAKQREKDLTEDISAVQSRWLSDRNRAAAAMNSPRTPDIEAMDMDTYSKSIYAMNDSLHDLQSDIHRIAQQQSQIQQMMQSPSAIQSSQQSPRSQLTQPHQSPNQPQMLPSHNPMDPQPFYISQPDPPPQRRTWGQPQPIHFAHQHGPGGMDWPQQPARRAQWGAPQPPPQRPPPPVMYDPYSGQPIPTPTDQWGNPMPYNGYHPPTSTYSAYSNPTYGGYNQYGAYTSPPLQQQPQPQTPQQRPFRLHDESGASTPVKSQSVSSAPSRTSTLPRRMSEQNDVPPPHSPLATSASAPRPSYSRQTSRDSVSERSERHASPNLQPRRPHTSVPAPEEDEMAPQNVSFIDSSADDGDEDAAMTPRSEATKRLSQMNITSGSKTYRVHEKETSPSPTRTRPTLSSAFKQARRGSEAGSGPPSLRSNSGVGLTEEEAETLAAMKTEALKDDLDASKGFVISFDSDAPKKPKPQLKQRRLSSKKNSLAGQSEMSSDGSNSSRKENVPPELMICIDMNTGAEDSAGSDHRTYSRGRSRGRNGSVDPSNWRSYEDPGSSDQESAIPKFEVDPTVPLETMVALGDPSSDHSESDGGGVGKWRCVSTVDIGPEGKQSTGLIIGDELAKAKDPALISEMQKKKERIMMQSLRRKQQAEEARLRKLSEERQQREEQARKDEERNRKKEEEKARREAILEQHRLKKEMDKADEEGLRMPEPVSAKPVPKLRAKSANKPPGRPRPKTIHVDQDADIGTLGSRGPRGSISNISGMSRSDSRNSVNQDLNSPRSGGGGGLSIASMGTGRHSAARAQTPSRRGSSVYIGGDDSDSPRMSRMDRSMRSMSQPRGKRDSSVSSAYGGGDMHSRGYRGSRESLHSGMTYSARRGSNASMYEDDYYYGGSMRDLSSRHGNRRKSSSASHIGPGSLPGYARRRGEYDDGASDISSTSGFGSAYGYRSGSRTRLYREPTSKSNRTIILNAIEYVVFPGVVNAETRNRVLDVIDRCDCPHFLLLFRDAKCQFRGLYAYYPDTEEVYKIYGTGPKQVTENMYECFFKYNSGGKKFTQIHTKHLTVTIDAFTIHNALWLGKKAKLPDKRDMALVV